MCQKFPSRFHLFRKRCTCTEYILITLKVLLSLIFESMNTVNLQKWTLLFFYLQFDKVIDLSAEESSEISLDGTVFLFAPAEATGHVLCMLGTM